MPGKKGEKATNEKQAKEVSLEKTEETSDYAENEGRTVDKDEIAESKQAEKRSRRGRPKNDDEEPAAKTPKREKKVKQPTPPSRVSKRISNQKTGRKLPDFEEEEKVPKKVKVKTKTTAEKDEENNKEVEESEEQDTQDERKNDFGQTSTNGTTEISASS